MTRDKAQKLSNMLGIKLYLREDGHTYQHPPGELIEPEAWARNNSTGHGSTPVGDMQGPAGSPVGSANEPIPSTAPAPDPNPADQGDCYCFRVLSLPTQVNYVPRGDR